MPATQAPGCTPCFTPLTRTEGKSMTVQPPGGSRLSTLDRLVLTLLLLTALGFGVIVVMRGALLKSRMTDLGVFLRAAWAVRSGEDLYTITDDKGLLYHYPALLA